MGRRFPDGRFEPIFGEPNSSIQLSESEEIRLQEGKTVLTVSGKSPSRIILIRSVETDEEASGLLVGRIRNDYLWGLDGKNILPPMSQFVVATATGIPLFGDVANRMDLFGIFQERQEIGPRVRIDDSEWLIARWSLFLKPQFGLENWTLVVFQPTDQVLAPLARFKNIFGLVVVLALLLVVILSLNFLRRSLEPIDALKIAAQKVAQKDFSHRVNIASRDEFEELAQGFNDMSQQLGRQFRILKCQAIIDKFTLMGHSFDAIMEKLICISRKEFGSNLVAVNRVGAEDPDDAMIYVGYRSSTELVSRLPWKTPPSIIERFKTGLPWMTINGKENLKKYLPSECLQEITSATAFPIFANDRLLGLLIVDGNFEQPLTHEALTLGRQAADHLAIAWTNIDMIIDLRKLTMGSMQALARAVDAKSPWTAGHSARVMRVALEIGEHMGLDGSQVDMLQQAALLHDIGKIGISSVILDKPGRLTDEEYDSIKTHPVIGEEILSPIPVFEDIIPMVRQHHERWDGMGYPDGLSGENINWGARILSVADVYDSMSSDRPYRKALAKNRVLNIMESESGRQFDPRVLAAFLALEQKKSVLAA